MTALLRHHSQGSDLAQLLHRHTQADEVNEPNPAKYQMTSWWKSNSGDACLTGVGCRLRDLQAPSGLRGAAF